MTEVDKAIRAMSSESRRSLMAATVRKLERAPDADDDMQHFHAALLVDVANIEEGLA